MTKQTVVRLLSLLLVIGAMVIMKSDQAKAQSPGQNAYNATKTGVGTAAAMTGFAAGACTVVTGGACGVGLVIGGLVLGGIGATLSAMPTPQDYQLGRIASPSQMPDYDYYGGSEACSFDGVPDGSLVPDMFQGGNCE